MRMASGHPVDEALDDLAVAAASNDIALVGRLLGPRDVNTVFFSEKELLESLVRHRLECSLLDVAVGSGSVEMTKYLLEFHGATPARETLKQSISTGNLELIKLMRERLPEAERRGRLDLLEVATEFHREEVLAWLLRDATVFDLELLEVFAVERKLAAALETALNNGYRPWWNCAREVALKWRAGAQMEFVSAPEGFSSDGGWWTDVSGVASALPGPGSGGGGGPARPERVDRVHSAFTGEWTQAMSEAHMDDGELVKSVVFPPGVTAIGESALMDFDALESVVFPASCTVIRYGAFERCEALHAVSIPAVCHTMGVRAFAGCSSLVSMTFPVGCTEISDGSLQACNSLVSVSIPDGCILIGEGAFARSGLKEVVIPDGCGIGDIAFFECAALRKVSIGSGCASIGYGAFRLCDALTAVTIGSGCSSIGGFAFSNCSRLASLVMPSTVQSIGVWGFRRCLSLATIAIPKACPLWSDAFHGCKTHVTRF
jgi:hypothetical protein